MRLVSSFLVLFAFWLLLSGFFTPFLMGAGALATVAVIAFGRRMDVMDHEGQLLHLAPRAIFRYWPWLLKEIVVSAWQVSRIIVDPRLPISPTLQRIKASQRTDVGRTVFANSITLTPGTIAVEVGRDEILVHALTLDGAKSLGGGEMDRRVREFEKAL